MVDDPPRYRGELCRLVGVIQRIDHQVPVVGTAYAILEVRVPISEEIDLGLALGELQHPWHHRELVEDLGPRLLGDCCHLPPGVDVG